VRASIGSEVSSRTPESETSRAFACRNRECPWLSSHVRLAGEFKGYLCSRLCSFFSVMASSLSFGIAALATRGLLAVRLLSKVDRSPIPIFSIVKGHGTADNQNLRGAAGPCSVKIRDKSMDQKTLSTILLILAGAVLTAYLLHRRKRKAE
jgi:hypothetical protein